MSRNQKYCSTLINGTFFCLIVAKSGIVLLTRLNEYKFIGTELYSEEKLQPTQSLRQEKTYAHSNDKIQSVSQSILINILTVLY